MISDEEGFLYPQINQKLCTDCNLCREICAFSNGCDTSTNLNTPDIYAVKHKDDGVRMTSTSGGFFTAISDYILDKGGLVAGVAFDENMNAVHQIAITKKERDKFKGSKYVQSHLGDIYIEIRNHLEQQKFVLFTGTPCQNAGLKNYLIGFNTRRLYLCDIVCYGTPSPLLWNEHIKHLEGFEKSKIVQYQCRSKIKGWHEHCEMVTYENGKRDYKSIFSQKHKVLFYSRNILRPSCHQCKYTNLQRVSDITMADFWGIQNCMPDFDDNKGVSLVLVNTTKGQELFGNIKGELIYRESNVKDCLQPHLQYPVKRSAQREQFWNDYHSKGYEYIVKKYAGHNLKSMVKMFMKGLLSRIGILNIVRKLL